MICGLDKMPVLTKSLQILPMGSEMDSRVCLPGSTAHESPNDDVGQEDCYQ